MSLDVILEAKRRGSIKYLGLTVGVFCFIVIILYFVLVD